MSRALPVMLDPYRLAVGGAEFSGEIPIRQFARVVPLLAAETGNVDAVLRFETGADHTTSMIGRITARVEMTCQRCLEPVTIDLDAGMRVLIVASEAEADRLDDSTDAIVVPQGELIHCVDLLEDEILLQLPLVSRHSVSDDCNPVVLEQQDASDGEEAEASPRDDKDNPFAVLKTLKK